LVAKKPVEWKPEEITVVTSADVVMTEAEIAEAVAAVETVVVMMVVVAVKAEAAAVEEDNHRYAN
jgi:hypothetical protein